MRIESEVTGVVCRIEAQPGQVVAEGDTLLLVESMKSPLGHAAMHWPLYSSVVELHIVHCRYVQFKQPSEQLRQTPLSE